MKFKANATFTIFDGEKMNVFNPGDAGELPDALIKGYVDAGFAEAVEGDETLADDADALAEMTGAPVEPTSEPVAEPTAEPEVTTDEPAAEEAVAAEDAAPVAPAKPKK